MIQIHKYIFGRLTRVVQVKPKAIPGLLRPDMPRVDTTRRKVIVAIEAISKDHALERLAEHFPHVARMDWDFIDEVDPADDIGVFGQTIKLEITRH